MKTTLSAVVLSLLLGVANPTWADPVEIKTGDTLSSQIESYKGKRVTLRLVSGEELTGTVRSASRELVNLGELAGKEYFDAIVDVHKVTALIVRTK